MFNPLLERHQVTKRNISKSYWVGIMLLIIATLPVHALVFVDTNGVTISEKETEETSGNPFIRHVRGADPSAQVWEDGKVWVYASHDQDDATGYESMDGYRVYSSYDMVNWTDHGEILHSRDVSWGTPEGGKMFAPDAAYKDGIYYLYFPHPDQGWDFKVGVAVSLTPEGPFTDIGNYIEGTDGIDPTCFIDDDGTAYLMWGGDHQQPRIARLKDNMTELAEEPRIIDYGRNDQEEFFEAGFIHKYNGKYYFSYNCNTCWPETGQYAIGDHPYGPYEYMGAVSDVPDGAQIHNSMVEYHNQWYYFYHMGNYNNGSLYRRNLCVDSMFYNTDGSIQKVVHTAEGVGLDPIGSTNGHIIPGIFKTKNFFDNIGLDTLRQNDTTYLSSINNGDEVRFVLDILGTEEYNLDIKVKDIVIGTEIYCLVNGEITDTIHVIESSDIVQTSVFLNKGKHTLSLQFVHPSSSADLMLIDWIKLNGDITYFTVEASAGNGGSISPDGHVYVAEGDSMVFQFDWMTGYQPDSIVVDGENQAPASFYTFYNLESNHTIQAIFNTCTGSDLKPFAVIDEGNPISSSEIEATEGSDVELYVEMEGEGELTWNDPSGYIIESDRVKLNYIKLSQAGEYTATFINQEGCKSRQVINLTVNPVVLDVYQAEDFISQSGIQTESCSDLGNGENIGFIENNDWCTYEITVDQVGVYEFIARAATSGSGGSIEISQDNKVLGTVNISNSQSGGWQDWYTTLPIEVDIKQSGNQTIKFTYKGSSGFLFNLNWFDLTYKGPLSTNKLQSLNNTTIYPNPLADRLNIESTFNIERIEIYNLQGRKVFSQLVKGKTFQAYIDLSKGVYTVHIIANERITVKKVIVS